MKTITLEDAELEVLLRIAKEKAKWANPGEEDTILLKRGIDKLGRAETCLTGPQLQAEFRESLMRGTFIMLKARGFLIDPVVSMPDELRRQLKEDGPQLVLLADDVGRLQEERANNLASGYADRVLP